MENIKKENTENNETRSRNFIEVEIDKDLAEGRYDTVCTRLRRSPTVTCTSATPSRFF